MTIRNPNMSDFLCDACPNYVRDFSNSDLPGGKGWIALVRHDSAPLHFCSWACVHVYSKGFEGLDGAK